MAIRGICFDIDGTLYPSWMTKLLLVPATFPSVRLMNAVRQFRNRVREEGYEHSGGTGEEAFLDEQAAYVLRKLNMPVSDESVSSMRAKIEKQLYRKMARYFRLIRPFPYLAETFEELSHSRGLLLSALSDFPVEEKLRTLGVADYVSMTCCAQETGYLKPHPAPFQYIAGRMNLRPEEILYVGDSYRKDMVGAKKAGMKTILLMNSLRGTKKGEKFHESHPAADMIFSDYRDFYRQVSSLISQEE